MKKFRIWWKRKGFGNGRAMNPLIRGIAQYQTEEKAKNQISRYVEIFPFNQYGIEPIEN